MIKTNLIGQKFRIEDKSKYDFFYTVVVTDVLLEGDDNYLGVFAKVKVLDCDDILKDNITSFERRYERGISVSSLLPYFESRITNVEETVTIGMKAEVTVCYHGDITQERDDDDYENAIIEIESVITNMEFLDKKYPDITSLVTGKVLWHHPNIQKNQMEYFEKELKTGIPLHSVRVMSLTM